MRNLPRLARLAGIIGSALLLAVTGAWLYGETVWSRWAPASPEQAFIHGTIGLETMPLKYALVLEKVSGPAFHTGREDGRSIWRTYGFLDNPKASQDAAPACVGNAADKLPVGFGISDFVPVKAIQTPVKFAGLTCAACHSGVVRRADGSTRGPVYGMGNPELDIIAWSDGVRSAVLDPELSAARILDAYDAQCGSPDSLYGRSIGRLIETVLIGSWLDGIRSSVADDLSRYDLPYAGARIKDSAAIPAGPGRTRPFRSIVRVALNLPGADNMALSKIPAVFEQAPALRPRSQYDGSVADPTARSFTAAYASGASVEALAKPEIVHDIKAAAAFTETLGIDTKVMGWADAFPDHPPDPQRVAAGFKTYQHYCNSCHGNRPSEDAPWSLSGADRIHEISPGLPHEGQPAIGTDTARLTFRYAEMLPLAIWTALPGWAGDLQAQKDQLTAAATAARAANDLAKDYFWRQQLDALDLASRKYRLGHPLYFAAKELIYEKGYINNPIPRAFLRAPYLHNGSVPTMRQLINLDPRPAVFCRGENTYDAEAVGYVAPPPDAQGRCPDRQSFVFDTTRPGNSNRGHDFPWRYDDPARDPQALEDLLEYLKTL